MESRLLDIDEVTASIMSVVAEATNEDRLLFKQWVAEACQDIGVSSANLKNCDLEPKDGSFRKPTDMTAAVDLALYNAGGQELAYNFIQNSPARIHIDRFAVNATIIGDPTNIIKVDLSEDVYYYHLGTNGTQVTKMKLSYLAMNVDRYGFPLVPESNLTAYKMFCRWMWQLRRNDNQSAIAQAEMSWLRERAMARGRNKMPDEFRGREMFKKYLSMVSSPIFE